MGIIAIDLDGTLIDNHHRLCNKSIDTIKKAQTYGYYIAIATGRAHFDVQKIFEHIDLQFFIIGANGATIHNPAGNLIYSVPVPRSQAMINKLKWLDKENYYYELFCDNNIYKPRFGKNILQNELKMLDFNKSDSSYIEMNYALEKQLGQHGLVSIDKYSDVFKNEENIYNILVFTFIKEKRLLGLKKFSDSKCFTISQSSPFNFDAENIEASKGNALVYLAQYLNIDMNYTMAVGDSDNDLSMLKVVSESFAMDNANDRIKKYVKYVTKSNVKEGVAKAIQHTISKWYKDS